MNTIARSIIDAIKTKDLTLEAEKFIIHWLSNEEKTSEDRDIIRELAMSGAFPSRCDNLFRGCKKLKDGMQSHILYPSEKLQDLREMMDM